MIIELIRLWALAGLHVARDYYYLFYNHFIHCRQQIDCNGQLATNFSVACSIAKKPFLLINCVWKRQYKCMCVRYALCFIHTDHKLHNEMISQPRLIRFYIIIRHSPLLIEYLLSARWVLVTQIIPLFVCWLLPIVWFSSLWRVQWCSSSAIGPAA